MTLRTLWSGIVLFLATVTSLYYLEYIARQGRRGGCDVVVLLLWTAGVFLGSCTVRAGRERDRFIWNRSSTAFTIRVVRIWGLYFHTFISHRFVLCAHYISRCLHQRHCTLASHRGTVSVIFLREEEEGDHLPFISFAAVVGRR